jgi:putative oxidoreductase
MKRYSLDVGRILLSIIFLGSAATKIADPAGTQAYMSAYGLPMTDLLLIGAIATEAIGGLALLLGLKARWAALVLTGFLAFATLIFHTNLGDQQQLLHFLKNVAIIGGLLLVTAEGTGPLSVDSREDPARAEEGSRSTGGNGREEVSSASPVLK